MADSAGRQDGLYREAAETFGAALERLAPAYERDPDRRRDLLQEIHVSLWRSLGVFNGRCSLRTWVYRVAHNVATSQVLRRRQRTPPLVSLEALSSTAEEPRTVEAFDRRLALDRLFTLIDRLEPLDRQLMVLYLEGLDAASIGEIVGLSPGNVATKTHRIRQLLARRFQEGVRPDA